MRLESEAERRCGTRAPTGREDSARGRKEQPGELDWRVEEPGVK